MQNQYKYFLTFIAQILIFSGANAAENNADLIIFSYNRPMQLYALLNSIDTYIIKLNKIHVLYRVNSEAFDKEYNKLIKQFSAINFVKQGNNPSSDFKPLLIECFNKTSAQYILFAVDDDVVKDHVDIQECCNILEETNSYCFFLRLGKNITKQYGQPTIKLAVPPCIEVKKDIFQYYLNNGCYGDWRYPNNVDMTLYKKADIQAFIGGARYHSPNTLEAGWALGANLNQYALFFKTSKMFALPLNTVQEDWITSGQNSWTSLALLKLWSEGYCIDLSHYAYIENDCAFMAEPPKFITFSIANGKREK